MPGLRGDWLDQELCTAAYFKALSEYNVDFCRLFDSEEADNKEYDVILNINLLSVCQISGGKSQAYSNFFWNPLKEIEQSKRVPQLVFQVSCSLYLRPFTNALDDEAEWTECALNKEMSILARNNTLMIQREIVVEVTSLGGFTYVVARGDDLIDSDH
uniref:Uncharacterized protein n=1 Tax=Romanomermis culicivorax TaxID=13658 RepID=A0A915KCG2_ROMCU